MSHLSEVLEALAARPGVRGAVLLSGDGLPIDQRSATPLDADAVAALAATLMQHGHRLGLAAERGELRTAVAEFQDGIAIMALLNEDAILFLIAEADTDVGDLLYDLRAHRPALAALL